MKRIVKKPLTVVKAITVLVLLTTVVSCGSYYNTSYYDDGIYSDNYQRVYIGDEQENQDNYYQQYFSSLNEELNYFTDVENYSSDLTENIATNNSTTSNNYGSWGSDPSSVSINIYNSPYYNGFYSGYYSPYYGYNGWGFGLGLGLGWGWGWGSGFYNPYYGYYNPYYPYYSRPYYSTRPSSPRTTYASRGGYYNGNYAGVRGSRYTTNRTTYSNNINARPAINNANTTNRYQRTNYSNSNNTNATNSYNRRNYNSGRSSYNATSRPTNMQSRPTYNSPNRGSYSTQPRNSYNSGAARPSGSSSSSSRGSYRR